MSQRIHGPSGRTSLSPTVSLTRKIKRGFRRIALRPVMASLLMMTLLLSMQPWTVWADGANTLKEPVDAISSRIKPSEMIGSASDWLKNLKRLRATRPVSHRSARKLHVKGDKLKMSVGTQQQVTAIAVDDNEDAVDGIKFNWSSRNPEVAQVDETGIVKALSVGQAEIVAATDALQESFHVRVFQHVDDDPIPDPFYLIPSAGNGRTASLNRNSGKGYKYRTASSRNGAVTSDPTPAPYQMSIIDPSPSVQTSPSENVGLPPNAPMSSGGVDPASSSYNRVFPIVGLGGRGEASVGLSLVYNSQLWTYDSTNSTAPYQYNVNRDWPGPGFHLDFGKISYKVGTGGAADTYMFVSSNGTRYPMANISSGVWETTDGSFIRIILNSAGNYSAYFPGGTVTTYDVAGPDGYYYASRVQDRNGNYFTVAYKSTKPQIDYITDTLGRNIQFFYTTADSNGNTWLSYITAPDHDNGSNSGRRTVANFYYDSSPTVLSGSFSNGTAKVNGIDVSTCTSSCGITYLHKIYYPSTGTGYVLTTSGVYGQITRVTAKKNMTSSTDGDDVAYTNYNYPSSGPLSETPKFDTRQEWWTGADSGVSVPVSYTYSKSTDSSYNIYTTTNPTGRKNVQKTPLSGTFSGISEIDEIQNSSGTALTRTTYSWNSDADSGSPQVSSVTYLDVPSSLSQHTNYVYSGDFNNPTETDEYGFSNELLRKTTNAYVTDTNYTSVHTGKPRILSLLSSSTAYNGTSSSATARTEFSYDTTSITEQLDGGSAVVGHDHTNFPTTFVYRGNRTAVKEYPDYANTTSSYIQHGSTYDVLGNIRSVDLSCCQQKTFTYSSTEKYSWPITITSGSSPSLSDSYTYQFESGNVLTHTDPTGRVTDYAYTVGDLRLNSTILATGAHVDMTYDDTNLKITQKTYSSSGTSNKVSDVETDFDGLGHTLTTKAWVGSSNYDQVDNVYDSLGRLQKQTNPYRSGSAPSPQLYTTIAYDELNRATSLTTPDSQSVQYAYDGRFTKLTDQVGRRKISAVDALGRTAQVIEVASNTSDYLNYSSISTTSGWGSVYGYSTTYSYDALDNLTTIVQGSQTRSFVYDGLSRLLYESLPEQVSNISYNSQNYSKKYEFDSLSSQHVNSNLRRVTDSRGAMKTLFYDGLNRLTACKYSGSPTATDFYYFWDGSTSVTIGADDFNGSSFTKTTSRPSGFTSSNSTGRISAIVSDGSTYGDYLDYGSDGEVLKHLQRVNSTDFTTQMAYNSLLMPTSLTYPSGRQIDYTYDSVMRPASITDHSSSVNYVSSLAYNSAEQPTAFNLGNGTNETFSYNNRLQLTAQTTKKSGATLLDFGYSYAGASGDHGAGTTSGNSGQLISMTDNYDSTKSVSYTYDLLGRMKSAQTPSGWSVKETYDRYGNRWQQDRVGNSPTLPASGSGTITISGSEHSEDQCLRYGFNDDGFYECIEWTTVYDSGSVSATVNGYTATAYYDDGSTSTSVAQDLTDSLNASASPVTASLSGTVITLAAKEVGASSNYSLSVTSSTSFAATRSGSTLTGGSGGGLGSGGTGPQSSLSFDLKNHINTSGYTYDNAGNLTADGTYTYTYDGENRQTAVGGGSTASYVYNAGRQRVSKTYSGVTTNYVYVGSQVLAEQEGSTWHDYVYLGSRLIADVTSSATLYHHPDRTATRLTTDSSGNVVSRQQTAPFGEVQTDTSSGATKRKFTSYDRDGETGGDFAINRQYVSTAGRFTQVDPIGMGAASLGNPQSFNLYAYTLNDPVNLVDPTGLGPQGGSATPGVGGWVNPLPNIGNVGTIQVTGDPDTVGFDGVTGGDMRLADRKPGPNVDPDPDPDPAAGPVPSTQSSKSRVDPARAAAVSYCEGKLEGKYDGVKDAANRKILNNTLNIVGGLLSEGGTVIQDMDRTDIQTGGVFAAIVGGGVAAVATPVGGFLAGLVTLIPFAAASRMVYYVKDLKTGIVQRTEISGKIKKELEDCVEDALHYGIPRQIGTPR